MKKNKNKQLRPLGDILLDIEPFILEMADHNIQHSDYYGLLFGYLEMHLPALKEEFTDGTRPVFYYGHQDGLKKVK